jgi:hypothetical protein
MTRFFYIIVCIIITCLLFYYRDVFLAPNNQINLNIFSYIGTIATLIGLIITIFEIINTSQRQEKIQNEIKKAIDEKEDYFNLHISKELFFLIDDIGKTFNDEKYKESLSLLLVFRRILLNINLESQEDLNQHLDNAEKILMEIKSLNEKPNMKKSKPIKEFQSEVIKIRNKLSNIISTRRQLNVATKDKANCAKNDRKNR